MTSERKYILFVDDEEILLQGLRRMMRSMRDEWDMAFLHSGWEALGYLEKNPVDVIVSDLRMSEMTGADLLTNVSRLYPDTVRIMLSGYAEDAGIYKSVGPSHQFLAKPCDPKIIMETISRSLYLRAQLGSTDLRSHITGIQHIPILPDIYREFMEEIVKPSASNGTISAIIDRDLGLSSTILKLTNSAYFSLPTRITNIRHAVQFLGTEKIHSLAVGTPLFEAADFDENKLPLLRRINNEARAIATIAKSIANQEELGEGKIEESFCAGFMSRLGHVLLLMQPDDCFEKYREMLLANPIERLELERDFFGAKPAEVGAYLLTLWGFSLGIVKAVLNHHNPAIMDKGNFDTTTVIHIASSLLNRSDNCLDKSHIVSLGKGDRLSIWQEIAAETIKNGVAV